jgi:hypothetical protein
VDQGFSSGNRHDRRTAFIGCGKTLSHTQSAIQSVFRIIDLAATGALQVAAEQGLQHQHQGVAPPSVKPLADQIARNAILLNQGDTHKRFPVFTL